MIYSFVLKNQNRAFSLAEHLVVGTTAGYGVGVAVTNLRSLAVGPLMKGQWLYIVPVILGAMLYTRYNRKFGWLSRIPVSLIVALASGSAIGSSIEGQILGQIRATMLPPNSLSNIVMIFGVLAVLSYFFFTIGPRSQLRTHVSKMGRFFMMAAFGATFASAVQGRFSLFVAQCQYILHTWLGLI